MLRSSLVATLHLILQRKIWHIWQSIFILLHHPYQITRRYWSVRMDSIYRRSELPCIMLRNLFNPFNRNQPVLFHVHQQVAEQNACVCISKFMAVITYQFIARLLFYFREVFWKLLFDKSNLFADNLILFFFLLVVADLQLLKQVVTLRINRDDQRAEFFHTAIP